MRATFALWRGESSGAPASSLASNDLVLRRQSIESLDQLERQRRGRPRPAAGLNDVRLSQGLLYVPPQQRLPKSLLSRCERPALEPAVRIEALRGGVCQAQLHGCGPSFFASGASTPQSSPTMQRLKRSRTALDSTSCSGDGGGCTTPRASSSRSSRNAHSQFTRALWRWSRLSRSAAESGGSGR